MIIVEFRRPAPLLNANARQHWAVRAQLVKQWRTAAYYAAVATRRKNVGPSVVTIYLPVPDRRKRDPSNWFLTTKCCVDGLKDAGYWPDDDATWVSTCEPVLLHRGDPLWAGPQTIRIEVRPR